MSYGHRVTLQPPAVFFAFPAIAVLHKGTKHKDICLQGGFILTLEGPRNMPTLLFFLSRVIIIQMHLWGFDSFIENHHDYRMGMTICWF